MIDKIEIDYDTERFIEGEPFDYEEAIKVHAEFCRIREERKRQQKQQGGSDVKENN